MINYIYAMSREADIVGNSNSGIRVFTHLPDLQDAGQMFCEQTFPTKISTGKRRLFRLA